MVGREIRGVERGVEILAGEGGLGVGGGGKYKFLKENEKRRDFVVLLTDGGFFFR